MPVFEHKVKIDARGPEESKELLQAMIDLMKAARQKLSDYEFIQLARKIKEDPSLILKAKYFI